MTFHISNVVYKNPYIAYFPLPPSSVQCLSSALCFLITETKHLPGLSTSLDTQQIPVNVYRMPKGLFSPPGVPCSPRTLFVSWQFCLSHAAWASALTPSLAPWHRVCQGATLYFSSWCCARCGVCAVWSLCSVWAGRLEWLPWGHTEVCRAAGKGTGSRPDLLPRILLWGLVTHYPSAFETSSPQTLCVFLSTWVIQSDCKQKMRKAGRQAGREERKRREMSKRKKEKWKKNMESRFSLPLWFISFQGVSMYIWFMLLLFKLTGAHCLI